MHHRRLEGQNLRALDVGGLLIDIGQDHLRTHGVNIDEFLQTLGLVTVIERLQLDDECALVGSLS